MSKSNILGFFYNFINKIQDLNYMTETSEA